MTLRLAILGDSIAYGTGAARSCDTLGPRLEIALAISGTPAGHRVFAVPGAVSAGLCAQVERALAWQPDVAVIVIGANDLTHFVSPVRAADQLGAALRDLRRVGVEVVVVPAPDLSVVTFVPSAVRELVRAASNSLRALQTRVTLAGGGRVADMTAIAPAFAADPALFSADRFHPSGAGYAQIALALTPAVRAAARDVAERST